MDPLTLSLPTALTVDPVFQYRVPLAPAGMLTSLRTAQTLTEVQALFETWPLGTEALLIASPVLERERHRPALRPKTARQLQRSLHRYLIRAATRSVPFGLFAALGAGEIGQGIPDDAPNLRVTMRLLSGPVQDVRPAIEAALPSTLLVIVNPTMQIHEGHLHWQPISDGVERRCPCREPLISLLRRCRTPVPLAHFQDQISSDLIRALLRAELLLSELQPHLTADDQHEHRQRALTSHCTTHAALWRTQGAFRHAPSVSDRIEVLRSALSTLGPDGTVQRQLALDASLEGRVHVPPSVPVHLVDGLRALRASPVATVQDQTIQQLAQEIGAQRVRLHEAAQLYCDLDKREILSPTPISALWPSLLDNIGRDPLHLIDEHLSQLPQDPAVWPAAFDVLAWLLSPDAEALARGDYTLALLSGTTPSPGQSSARLRVQHDHLPAPAVAPDQAIATALCLQHPRASANDTALCRPDMPLELHVPGHPSIEPTRRVDLVDLWVEGGDQIRVWCERRQQYLHLYLPTLTRTDALGPVARFLAATALQRRPPRWDWGLLRGRPFLPRVVRGRCILSAARWRFPEVWQHAGEVSDRQLLTWLSEAGVPSLVRAGRSDRLLTLDLQHPVHRDLLRAEWRSGVESVTEALALPEQAWFVGHDAERHLFEGIWTVRTR